MRRLLARACVFIGVGFGASLLLAVLLSLPAPSGPRRELDAPAIRRVMAMQPVVDWGAFDELEAERHGEGGRSVCEVFLTERPLGSKHVRVGRDFGKDPYGMGWFDNRPRTMVLAQHEAGWPVPCVAGWERPVSGAPNETVGLLEIGDRRIPARPLVGGLVIDTLVMAGMLASIALLVGLVRRAVRARRGRCVHCAFPVGTSSVCTECGRAVRTGASASRPSQRPREAIVSRGDPCGRDQS